MQIKVSLLTVGDKFTAIDPERKPGDPPPIVYTLLSSIDKYRWQQRQERAVRLFPVLYNQSCVTGFWGDTVVERVVR